jgi:hypothetical protein
MKTILTYPLFVITDKGELCGFDPIGGQISNPVKGILQQYKTDKLYLYN